MKIFIGIDFSKEKFDAVLISMDYLDCKKAEHSVFENNSEGYRNLLKWIKGICPKSNKEDFHFCGEHTGSYSRPLSDYLLSRGYPIYLENAYKIQRSSGLLRGKNDMKDALMIAEYILRNLDKATPYNGERPSIRNLDVLFKQRRLVVKMNTEIECKLHSLDFSAEKVRQLACNLDKYCDIKKGRAILKFDKMSKLGLEELAILHNLITLEINKLQVAELDRRMCETVKEDEALQENYAIITSIPGIALQNAVAMLIYTDNFKRFGYNGRKLASYYGVAVFSKESGSSVHTSPHTSHLANKMLKSLLSQAALASVTHCAPMRSYYQRMLSRGKKSQVALNNVKNKLLHMVMSMIRNKTKYDENAYGRTASKYVKPTEP